MITSTRLPSRFQSEWPGANARHLGTQWYMTGHRISGRSVFLANLIITKSPPVAARVVWKGRICRRPASGRGFSGPRSARGLASYMQAAFAELS